MKMTKIMGCDVTECAYNKDKHCRTLAATIGDMHNPRCDTYLKSQSKGGDDSIDAGVGACKVADCRHNERFECQADQVQVGYQGSEPDCLTFEHK